MFRDNVCAFLFVIWSFSVLIVSSRPTNETNEIIHDPPNEKLNNTRLHVPTKWERGMELLGQILDAMRFGTGRLVNFAMMARNVIADRAEEFTSEAANKVVAVIAARDARKIIQKNQKRSTVEVTSSTPIKIGAFDAFLPPKTRETVRLETEAGQSLFEIQKPKPVQTYLQNFLSPVPIVDRITEKDKYGNSGDKFIGIGRAVVNGFEGLSNFLNALVDLPVIAVKKTSRGITTALNQVGGKLVGLE